MKTLFPKQQESCDRLVASLNNFGGALDASLTGTGKTVVACSVAAQMKVPVAVICPKIVIPHWRRELAEFGIEPVFVLNYEKLRRGSTDHVAKVGKKMFRWRVSQDTLLIFDECHNCLPSGTRVVMTSGTKCIEDLSVGDSVLTPLGARRITGHYNTGAKPCLTFIHEYGELTASHDHKILTDRGWIEAIQITERDRLVLRDLRGSGSRQPVEEVQAVRLRESQEECKPDMPCLLGDIPSRAVQIGDGLMLLSVMCVKTYAPADERGGERSEGAEDAGECPKQPLDGAEVGADAGGWQPNEITRGSGESIKQAAGSAEATFERGERYRNDSPSGESVGGTSGRMGSGVHSMVRGEGDGMADHGGGSGISGKEMGDRGRWAVAQRSEGSREGCEERPVVARQRMDSISSYQQTSYRPDEPVPLRYSRVLRVEVAETLPCFDISVEDVPCFFAEGVLVHNCKGAFTQNSQLLIAAKQAGLKTLLLSATACQDPTEMRAIGYALGLHSLNKPENGLKSWFGWMQEHGCWKDQWQNWKAGPVRLLTKIRDSVYQTGKGVKLTPNDLPSAFADNHIITEPLAFGSIRDIAAFYKTSGITPDIVESTLEGRSPEPFVLVEILRARQLAEAAKVPDVIDLVQDAVAEGYSAVVFVNFVDTVQALSRAFPDAAIIVGGQSAADREDNVQRFQTNQTNVIIANIAAGGVGVSLHDTVGGHPRMSFISPTFNVKDYIQTLGRIHRNGAKSPSTQRILVASNTIEEKIVEVLEKKRLSLDTLHAQSSSANN